MSKISKKIIWIDRLILSRFPQISVIRYDEVVMRESSYKGIPYVTITHGGIKPQGELIQPYFLLREPCEDSYLKEVFKYIEDNIDASSKYELLWRKPPELVTRNYTSLSEHRDDNDCIRITETPIYCYSIISRLVISKIE